MKIGKKKGNKKNKNRKGALYIVAIAIVLVSLTIGYTAFSDQFTITDFVAHVRVYRLVRVNGVTTNSGAVSDLDYNTNSILNTVYIPAGESVTYSVTATNLGNVPVAASDVSFSNGNGTVSNLSADISPSSYVKICDTNNECTNGISKTFDVTITNTGNSAINGELDVNITFTELYKVIYEGSQIGNEILAGSNFTYQFISNPSPPAKVSKISGDCDSFNYNTSNNTLTVTNVQSDIEFTESHTITYNGSVLGYANDGATYTKTFDSQWPATITKNSGTCDSVNYVFSTHTLTLTNVLSDISLTGTIGKVEITRIQYVENSAKNVLDNPIPQPTFHDMETSFSITFERPEGSTETDFEITYEVDITNTHYDDYIFRGLDFHPTITASATSDTATLTLIPNGIANGDIIASGTTKTFRVTLKLNPNNNNGSYSTTGQTSVDTTPDTEEETGTITATINPTTGDLRSQNGKNEALAAFTLSVTSTYPSDKEFRLALSNSNLEITDSSGVPLGNFTIHAESTEQYTIYIKSATGATYQQNTTTTNIYLGAEGSANTLIDGLTLTVDIYNVPDTTPITVGKVQISMHRASDNDPPTTGQIDVEWDRIDKGGDKVTDYYIQLYNNSGTLVDTGHITVEYPREYSFTGVADGSYKAVVYGIDQHPNSGASYASASTTTANGYASASTLEPFEWRFDVTVTAANLAITGDGTDVALLEQSHTVTLTASGTNNNGDNYIVADSVTVKVNGDTVTSGYSFQRSSDKTVGTITIDRVTGNIEITASRDVDTGGCLVEGTKILLANGKYKNVENIGYDDLLLVYNHETGTLVPEYPIWIKQKKVNSGYQKTTFSDGTILKTVSIHSMFDVDLNRFVDMANPEEFHVGSRVFKIKDDLSGLETVTVTKIEGVDKPVNYYHIVTLNYFNNFANGLFVSDGHVDLLNRYGFTENMMWNSVVREYARQDMYKYEELQDILPRHIFEGTLAAEAKILTQSGYGIEKFREFIEFVTGDMMKPPIQKNGKNMWMVTTSLDNINEFNKNEFLREEGSTYTLPGVNNKKFIGWLSYSDNKMYNPGDKLEVYHGMHFEAIFK